MRRAGIIFFGAALICSLPTAAWAEQSGASFLKIGVGARALGMASAFTATADDVTAVFWNPAGLAQLSKRQVAAMHTNWLSDINFDHLVYAHPTPLGTFAGSMALLRQGDLERRSENRQNLGSFSAQDTALSVSFSRPISVQAGYGVSVKWVEQRIDDERASGPALDMGWLRRVGGSLRVAAALQNFGPRLRFIDDAYSLPTSAVTGASYRFFGVLNVGVDARRYLQDKRTSLGLGTEYWLMGRVALRTGYLSQFGGASSFVRSASENAASRLGQLTGLNMGVGVKIYSYQMDYALVSSGEFGNTQRLSMSLSF